MREARFVQVGPGSAETVLQDWSAVTSGVASYAWTPTSGDVSLRVDVRDASYTLHSTMLSVGSSPAPQPQPQAGEWKQDSRGWWYRNADGSYPKEQAVTIGGTVYRFDASGYMRTGWVKDGGSWYYHAGSGAQATGWLKDGGSWYYLDPSSGAMTTGWLQISGTWYHFSNGGQWIG